VPAKQETRTKNPALRLDLSLRGRRAWAVQLVEQIRDEGNTEALGWILDQWIESTGREYLLKRYNVDVSKYSKLETPYPATATDEENL